MEAYMSFSTLWIDTAEVKLTQNAMILFPSSLYNLSSKLTFLFFKWSFMALVEKLEGSECDAELIP